MVMVVSDERECLQLAIPGLGYDGVVYVQAGNFSGTGSLLYGGRAILTAAHVVESRVTDGDVYVRFETAEGVAWRQAQYVTINPEYDPDNVLNDLAVIWLAEPAPASANRYDLYRDENELTQPFTMVGYGNTGTGVTGEVWCSVCEPTRRYAENTFDTTATQLKAELGAIMGWYPQDDTQLMADFDDGTVVHDALGQLVGLRHLGVGQSEGLIAAGDSGGPAFIDNKVAGVASYGVSLATTQASPDIDNVLNASFGEIAAWQRVSRYQQWIDETLRTQYADMGAPASVDQVRFELWEGDSGISYVWFWVSYAGPWDDITQQVSVQYRTVDGTAKAGEDYVPISGELRFYPGETGIPIPVEIIGDTIPEPDETVYLEIYEPEGGQFPGGVQALRAARTIVDDDGYWVA